jgi:phosphomevalonate kinase
VKVIAPGKLLLTGAYAVLEGAPAIVAAIDRYAIADSDSPGKIDVRALHDESGTKLGLGSSAAAIVASLAARALDRGEDPRQLPVRAVVFRQARDAHARQQGGGSGVDVAASVFGGVLRYVLERGAPILHAVEIPPDLTLAIYWSGTSARTSDLRARVDAFRGRPGAAPLFASLRRFAEQAADAVDRRSAPEFVASARDFGRALDGLGQASDAPIVLPAFAELAALAEREQAAFLPSGAGGGDIAIWLGTAPPPDAFERRAEALSLRRLSLSVDRGGVRPESRS